MYSHMYFWYLPHKLLALPSTHSIHFISFCNPLACPTNRFWSEVLEPCFMHFHNFLHTKFWVYFNRTNPNTGQNQISLLKRGVDKDSARVAPYVLVIFHSLNCRNCTLDDKNQFFLPLISENSKILCPFSYQNCT